jgi:hypothetical protein
MVNDLTGQKFGSRTVISDSGLRRAGRSGNVLWKVRCNCGKEKLLMAWQLKKSNSCGCQKSELQSATMRKVLNRGGYAEIFASHWNSIKRHAKKRNLIFSITAEYAWNLFLKQNRKCALTGDPIAFSKDWRHWNGSASLDRINSSNGYIEGNVQWVHKYVNVIKWDFSVKEFVDICRKVCIIADRNEQQITFDCNLQKGLAQPR